MTGMKLTRIPRIAVGGILTECNHLGGLPIDLSIYEACELFRDEVVLELTTSAGRGNAGLTRARHTGDGVG